MVDIISTTIAITKISSTETALEVAELKQEDTSTRVTMMRVVEEVIIISMVEEMGSAEEASSKIIDNILKEEEEVKITSKKDLAISELQFVQIKDPDFGLINALFKEIITQN